MPTVGSSNGFTAVQTYNYDSLNRLKSATETISGSQSWKQTFTFDRYGNRRFDPNNTTTLGSCPANQCNPTIDAANNRFTTGQGYTFDLTGNLITDAQGRSFTFDGENKQTKVTSGGQTVGEYFYDGDGKRVKKKVYAGGALTEETIFVYDAVGKLVAEYSNQTSQTPQVSYLTSDNLGSPRITTDANGQVLSRRDFMPFGEEITSSQTAQRNINLHYGQDTVRQKFTQKERDTENGLDFFDARYYTSSQGRFMSVDPLEINFETNLVRFLAFLSNPQNQNKYSYVLNNPLDLTDPDGREPNKSQAGTIQNVVAIIQQIERQNPNDNRTEILKKADQFFRNQADVAGNIRYVYTKENGWIDAKHFFAAANEAANSSTGEIGTNVKGIAIEILQTLQRNDSAFSYEDIGSNAAGAEFGAKVFNPSGGLLSEQVATYFNNTLGATAPTAAPNYEQLPNHLPLPNDSGGSRTRGSQTASNRTDSTQSTTRSASNASTLGGASASVSSTQRRTANRGQSDSRGRSRKRNKQ